ncbi:UPF0149 family protein [Thalassomonas actiniarum]|uniref:UPF0149 family protein n=1 Tax=Thalassomonas actiniarum TaxID=485447 RepID=A0AAE9YQU6_9GAMM|nr:UPF0149 family protein [Thalassomonas actiniarum]WDD97901.1 UPF0149 family protein [Thalassomonas actiniarum]
MADETRLDFASVQAVITASGVNAHGAELHGVLTGLICAGFSFDDHDYMAMINDLFNNGEGLPKDLKDVVKQMFGEVWQDLLDESYRFQLLLPDDDETIVERGHALGVWVQGFNLGFGLQQKNNPVLSDDVKEVLTDFAEIANLSDDVEEDEETEQAYYEIAEYARMSALLCFSELGTPPSETEDPQQPKTLH